MDFEELALKGIDPSLGPSLTHPDFRGRDGDDLRQKGDEGNNTPIISVSLFSFERLQSQFEFGQRSHRAEIFS